MATKYFKLKEHGTQETIVVTERKLAQMKEAPSFNRVFTDEGLASEEDVAAYRNTQREAGNEVEEETAPTEAKSTGQPLPQANPGANATSGSAAADDSGASGTSFRTTKASAEPKPATGGAPGPMAGVGND